ncbi:uncharacterized protein N7473_012586 [Penicillium subrubescens]|nr:uncharacterized protein N7473_012586 [Penicillium subrubescens]KAJ5875239.1 hypothetical protein N7473_012586 [Penicillium subrubescens]
MAGSANRLANVATFLIEGGLVGAKTSDKPNLFCTDDFAVVPKYGGNDLALDGNGKEMVISYDEDGDPETGYTVADVYPHIQAMGDNITPYWVSLLKGYTFATGPYVKLCDKEKRQGITSRADSYPNTEAGSPKRFTYASFNRHMLLCPRSFTNEAGKGPHSQPTVAGLVTSTSYPSKGDARSMDRFGTLSCTLYHELFHIVDSAGTDADNGLYDAIKIMLAGKNKDDNLVNAPEPYVLLALAAYMYENPPSGATAMWYWPIGGWQQLQS